MGCGCNKKRRSSTTQQASTTQPASPPPSQPASSAPARAAAAAQRAERSTMARTTSYVLQMDSGVRQRFSTRLEAEAARVRFGGDGTIRER